MSRRTRRQPFYADKCSIRGVAVRSKARTDPADRGTHLCGKELSLDLDARHFARDGREPRRTLSLLQIERRVIVSDSGSLFWPRARTFGAAHRGISDPFEKLRIFIDNHLSFFAANMAEMKVLSHEAESLAGDLHKLVATKKERYARVARKILREIAEQERTNVGIDLTVATYALFG